MRVLKSYPMPQLLNHHFNIKCDKNCLLNLTELSKMNKYWSHIRLSVNSLKNIISFNVIVACHFLNIMIRGNSDMWQLHSFLFDKRVKISKECPSRSVF